MKVLDFSQAPNPRRLHLFVAEKGIEVDFEQVDLESDAHLRSDYYDPKSTGHFPILVLDDGSYVSESVAICRYLERLHPNPALLGSNPIEEARIEMWNRRIELGLFRHVTDYFGHTAPFFQDRIHQIPDFAKSAQKNTLTQLERLDRTLSEQAWIAGDAFSIADISAFVAIDLGIPSVFELGPEHKNIDRWFKETATRPGVSSVAWW